MKKIVNLLLVLMLFVGCEQNEATKNAEIQPENVKIEDKIEKEEILDNFEEKEEIIIKTNAEILLEDMTLEEKIGQLFIIRPNSFEKSSKTILNESMIEQMQNYHIGGIAIFSENIQSETQLKKLIADFQENSEIPLFISVDEEGGGVARLANSSALNISNVGNMGNIGKTLDTENAFIAGQNIGEYLLDYGFNLDFAPVVDINTNSKNIVIGNRAFYNDATVVTDMSLALMNGLNSKNIMSCIKHFPGHGDTKNDTHLGYVSINKTWDELLDCELIPFIENMEHTDMIMVSHISAPNITLDNLPSSLSKEMIFDKLRLELGYDGVVITDALEMGAIINEYKSDEVAIKVILAGVDIILMPENFELAYNALYDAVISKEIDEEIIDKAVLRILNLKEKYNLI